MFRSLSSFFTNVVRNSSYPSDPLASPSSFTPHVISSAISDQTRDKRVPGMMTKMDTNTCSTSENSIASSQADVAGRTGSHDEAAIEMAGATASLSAKLHLDPTLSPSPASSNLSSAPPSPTLESLNNNYDQESSTLSISSPLSSAASRSPSPPSELDLGLSYPSPLPSQESASSHEGSPTPTLEQVMQRRVRARDQAADQDQDQAPPVKRRKLTELKPRTTEHLDLSRGSAFEDDELTERLIKSLHNARKIVVVAGAGISVSAGIPDFRSDTGLFKSLRKEHKLKSSGKDLFDASVYKDSDSTAQFHDMVRNMANDTQQCSPTPFHHLLATLADQGRLLRLYTQNIDSLDTQLPPLATQVPLERRGPWPTAIQVHGNLQKMVCVKCRLVSDLRPEIFDGPTPPECENCVEVDRLHTEVAGKRSRGIGWLRPRMVLYNESNPDEEAIGAVMAADLKKRPDALIVVGTTLQIPGMKRLVREMCGVIRGRKEGLTVWLNRDPPPAVKDYEWDLIVKASCDEVANRAQMRKWNAMDDVPIYTPIDDAESKSRNSPEVVVTSPSKRDMSAKGRPAKDEPSETTCIWQPTIRTSPKKGKNQVTGIPTPVASPRMAPLQPTGATAIPLAALSKKSAKKTVGRPVGTPQTKKPPAKKIAARKNVPTKAKPKQNGMLTFSVSKSHGHVDKGKDAKKSHSSPPKEARKTKVVKMTPLTSAIANKSGATTTAPMQNIDIFQEALELLSSPEPNKAPSRPRTPSKAMQLVSPSEGRMNGGGSWSPLRPICSPIPENHCSDVDYWGSHASPGDIENVPKPVDPSGDPWRQHSPDDRVHPELCKVMSKRCSPSAIFGNKHSNLDFLLKLSPVPKDRSSTPTDQATPELKVAKHKYIFTNTGPYVGESKEERQRTISPTSVPGSMQKLLN